MATTATIPDCHTEPVTAFFGLALANIIIKAAAEIIIIWMTIFICNGLLNHSVTPVTCTFACTNWLAVMDRFSSIYRSFVPLTARKVSCEGNAFWKTAKKVIMTRAPIKIYTAFLADCGIFLSKVVAVVP